MCPMHVKTSLHISVNSVTGDIDLCFLVFNSYTLTKVSRHAMESLRVHGCCLPLVATYGNTLGILKPCTRVTNGNVYFIPKKVCTPLQLSFQ